MTPLSDYDFPISHGHYRALQAMHGLPVSPNVDAEPYAMTEEEHHQKFIKWQYQQQEIAFGYSSKGSTLLSKESKSPRPMYKHQPMSYNHQHTVIDI